MAKITTPLTGGSYIRGKDGSLTKVAETLADAPTETVEIAEAAADPKAAPADTSRKGK
ncbi:MULTISPECIES: hypothetical protein [unclassified Mesorhizobium]|uniref:hypothetical protein n=1 Tax=unclassified Mesorhizobium TaxID=325217 RepID=UPI0015E38FD7|nr:MULTISPECIES: hypothetical protein [unclassified Mesorhizobium]